MADENSKEHINVDVDQVGDVTIVRVKGKIDALTGPDLEALIVKTINGNGKKVLIDLKNVDYVSSAGLKVLLHSIKTVEKKSGRMIICSPQKQVKEVFVISGLDRFFDLVETENESLEKFR